MPIINFNGVNKIIYSGQEMNKIYCGSQLVWERKKILHNMNTTALTSNLKSGWYIDAIENPRTIFDYDGDRVGYYPQPGSYVPYIAIKLDKPMKKGERWFYILKICGDYPSTHQAKIEVGSDLRWSTTNKQVSIDEYWRGWGFYLIRGFIDYTSTYDAQWFYISYRAMTPIGEYSPHMYIDRDFGVNVFNLTSDGLEHLSSNQIITKVNKYQTKYEMD